MRIIGNAVALAFFAGYALARIAYGGPAHATPLDLIVSLVAISAGFVALRLTRVEEK